MQDSYEIAFSGRIAEGVDLAQVKANLARLFKADSAKITALFSGKRVIIKRGLDRETALKYQAALKQAGAICEVLAPHPPAAAVTARSPSPDTGGMSVAPPGVTLIEPEAIAPLEVNVSGMSMAEPGVTLIEPRSVPPLEVDVSGLSMAEAGAILAQPNEPSPLHVNVSGMSMAEPGATLVEPEVVEPLEVDTSRLSTV